MSHAIGGDKRVRSLTCAEQFLVMAFSHLSSRESMRDIETRLPAQDANRYHMGWLPADSALDADRDS